MLWAPVPYIGIVAAVLADIATGRLADPYPSNQLNVGEADALLRAAAGSNPELDAWHDAEEKKIDEECKRMMRDLMMQKGRKLQEIVDKRQQELYDTQEKLEEAKMHAKERQQNLKNQGAEFRMAKGGLPETAYGINATAAVHEKWDQEVLRLEALVAEKKACIERMKVAKKDMLQAQRRLAELRKELADKEALNNQKREKIVVEEKHVSKEISHVDVAEDDYDRAQARLDDVLARLAKAEADLQEHDDATRPGYDADAMASFMLHASRPVQGTLGVLPVKSGVGAGQFLKVGAVISSLIAFSV